MVQAEALRYVTVPAHRRMCFKDILELIYIDLIPTQQLSIWALKSRSMVQPMNFLERTVAIDAIPAAIPSH